MTGGAGFIGSNFVKMALTDQFPLISKVAVLDKLTYAGKLSNLNSVLNDKNFEFCQGDICDSVVVDSLMSRVDSVINFAAESHVDRSIQNSDIFVRTNVVGTQVLLDSAKKHKISKFIQVSTDEVYGSIAEGSWSENNILEPNSPYSATKAAADLLSRSFFVTHGLNINVTRCSNNFGPFQDPEKLIPNFVTRLVRDQAVPVYGDGANVRDWLFVNDHCKGIYLVLTRGKPGEIYNIGGGKELTNLELTRIILKMMGKSESSIIYVKDRLGHDRRYSVSYQKIEQLGYSPESEFHKNLKKTIDFYVDRTI